MSKKRFDGKNMEQDMEWLEVAIDHLGSELAEHPEDIIRLGAEFIACFEEVPPERLEFYENNLEEFDKDLKDAFGKYEKMLNAYALYMIEEILKSDL